MKKKKLTSQKKKRIRSVENTQIVSTHTADKRGFVVVATWTLKFVFVETEEQEEEEERFFVLLFCVII